MSGIGRCHTGVFIGHVQALSRLVKASIPLIVSNKSTGVLRVNWKPGISSNSRSFFTKPSSSWPGWRWNETTGQELTDGQITGKRISAVLDP